jgi:hypothetical protein
VDPQTGTRVDGKEGSPRFSHGYRIPVVRASWGTPNPGPIDVSFSVTYYFTVSPDFDAGSFF